MVIPIFIMVFAYYRVGIYPGGPNTVLTFDMQTQYMPFFASLRYLRSSDNSLFFNMSGALGNNFMGFAYYIFSPFTWITVLFPLELLPEAIYFTTLLRIGICGLNFCIYLLYRFKEKRYYLGTILLSCCYALMSYNVGYSINIMWLDAILMLPIILVGVERIIRDRKTTVLTFSDGNIKIVKLDVITENDAPVWICIGKKEKNEIKINKNYDGYQIEPILLINGGDFGTYRGNDTGAFYELYLGDFKAGEKINIELVDYDDFGEIYVSQFDENVYHKIIDKLKEKQLKLTEHSAGRFKGRIDAGAGGNMILTLPAIDGWKIRVNGKLTDYDNYRGVFVLIPLSSGMNDLEIWFISPGCVCGVILGTVSALVFILLLIGKKGNSDEKRKRF